MRGDLAIDAVMDPASELAVRLAAIWRARLAGSIAEAQASYQAALEELGLTAAVRAESAGTAVGSVFLTDRELAEWLLPEVSFLRRSLRMEESERLLARVAELLQGAGGAGSYQFHLQSGLNRLCLADKTQAFDHFVRARGLALDDFEYSYAACNVILCAEDLDLSYGDLLDDFLSRFAPHRGEAWAKGVADQVDALLVRHAFRGGDGRQLQSYIDQGVSGSQAAYHLALLCRLPHLCFARSDLAEARAMDVFLGNQGDAYMSQYLFRSLAGILHEDDLQADLRPSEQIERFYLWTWAWLAAPTTSALNKLLRLRGHILKTLATARYVLSPDDYLQLECALLWIGFFLRLDRLQIDQCLAETNARINEACIPTLAYEKTLLDYLYKRRDGDQPGAAAAAAALRGHPAASVAYFQLPALLAAVAAAQPPPVGLGGLLGGIEAMLRPADMTRSGITLELSTGKVRVARSGAAVVELRNHAIAQLVLLFTQKDQWHVSVLMQQCFGYRDFDDIRHAGKLAKLLTTANRATTPFLKFSKKGLFVLGRAAPGAVEWQDSCEHTRQLFSQEAAFDQVARRAAEPVSAVAPRPARQKIESSYLTRREIEALLGCSRAAAIQQINAWLAAGQVVRQGVGKASRYRLDADLRRTLSSAAD